MSWRRYRAPVPPRGRAWILRVKVTLLQKPSDDRKCTTKSGLIRLHQETDDEVCRGLRKDALYEVSYADLG